MAYIGKCDCHQCGREADAHTNIRGLGYYNCGPCGFRAQQKTERGNRLFLAKVRRDTEHEEVPEMAPEIPANRSESQTTKATPEAKKRPGGLLQNSIFAGAR